MQIRSRRDIWVHLMLYPGHTLPTAAAPILVAAGLAAHDDRFALWPMLVAFLCSWLVHVGGVFVDVYQLVARYPEIREHPELNDAVARGELHLPILRAATVAWFVAALPPGVYLLHVVGPIAIALGAVGIVAAASYALTKRSVASMGLADVVFFAMFGLVAVPATYYVQAHALTVAAFVVGLPVAALVNNVLVIDDIRDIDFDRAKGWRTTAVRFGVTTSRREHLAFTLVGYLAPLAFAYVWGAWLLLPLVTLPFAIGAEIAVWTAPRREVLIPWTPRSAFLAMGYAALLGLGLALA